MNIRNCKKCGQIFNYVNNPVCDNCVKQEADDFKRVKEYLYEHPKAPMIEVSRELEISLERLKRYLKEGRLEIVGDDNFLLECESCGKSVKTGRYCDDCGRNMAKGLQSASSGISDQKRRDEEEAARLKAQQGFKFMTKDKR